MVDPACTTYRFEVPVTPMLPSPPWSLHPQLAADTIALGDLPLARALLMNDANYPWLVLVPRRMGAVEIIDLDESQQAQLMGEIALLARVLKDVTGCDKLNIAAIGNMVPQLHVHVVARRRDDAVWPRPVWGAIPARAYAPGEREALIAAIRRQAAFA
jgi:diadenosine tetraphosphate (Ap4A) HIT family hydrolase